ncbi:MAG TPA: hypothetical protein VKP13_01010 [Nitrospira sp.]|nr:hypothetical protein [Nitrospira sp.]
MATFPNTTALVPVDPRRRTLLSIRESLVALHGALIVAEQLTYEGINGPVESVDALLSLLQKDPWFTWLHPFADLLVRIDRLLEDECCDITDENLKHLLQEINCLLHPSVEGDGFERAYYEALDRAPDVVLAHFRVRKLLPRTG